MTAWSVGNTPPPLCIKSQIYFTVSDAICALPLWLKQEQLLAPSLDNVVTFWVGLDTIFIDKMCLSSPPIKIVEAKGIHFQGVFLHYAQVPDKAISVGTYTFVAVRLKVWYVSVVLLWMLSLQNYRSLFVGFSLAVRNITRLAQRRYAHM